MQISHFSKQAAQWETEVVSGEASVNVDAVVAVVAGIAKVVVVVAEIVVEGMHCRERKRNYSHKCKWNGLHRELMWINFWQGPRTWSWPW